MDCHSSQQLYTFTPCNPQENLAKFFAGFHPNRGNPKRTAATVAAERERKKNESNQSYPLVCEGRSRVDRCRSDVGASQFVRAGKGSDPPHAARQRRQTRCRGCRIRCRKDHHVVRKMQGQLGDVCRASDQRRLGGSNPVLPPPRMSWLRNENRDFRPWKSRNSDRRAYLQGRLDRRDVLLRDEVIDFPVANRSSQIELREN